MKLRSTKRYTERHHTIQRTLERVMAQGYQTPYDLAAFVAEALSVKEKLDRQVRAFNRHRSADAHCTCNDCLSFAEGTHPTQQRGA